MRDRHEPRHPPLAPVFVEPHTCDHAPDPSWSGCAVLDAPPPLSHHVDADIDPRAAQDSCSPEEARYLEFGESGWWMMILWAAGTDRIVRCLETRPPPPVRITHRSPDGSERHWALERTRHDQAGIDRDIDLVLGEAGAPAQPSGYRWFLRLPDPGPSAADFVGRLHEALGSHPLQSGALREDLAAFGLLCGDTRTGLPPG